MGIIKDESMILNGYSEYFSKQGQAIVRQQLFDLGVNPYFWEKKHFSNIYIVKAIVEGYNWKRNISNEEKRFLIEKLLGNVHLDKDKKVRLVDVIRKFMQRGLSQQKIYGMLINYVINTRNVLNGKPISYTDILIDKENTVETIAKNRDLINTTVNMSELMIRVAENLSDEEKEKTKAYIESLGIDVSEKENTILWYILQRVVESYNFERKLEKDEKSFLVKKMLSMKRMKKDSLICFIRRLVGVGLSEQEIYGAIINLAVDEKIAEGEEYEYPNVLKKDNKVLENPGINRDNINTDVDTMQIMVQTSKSQRYLEIKRLKQELVTLGVNPEIISNKSIESLYLAKRIVELCDFDRSLENKEKSALIHAILNESSFAKNFSEFFSRIAAGLQVARLTVQQKCATIINFAVNRSVVVGEKIYKYGELEKEETCRAIGENVDDVAIVTDQTIKKAVDTTQEMLKGVVRLCNKKGMLRSVSVE